MRIDLRGARFQSGGEAEIETFLKAYESGDDKPLVIHFHGGLVPAERGNETATRLATEYDSDGGRSAFFVWDSGFRSIIEHNLPKIVGAAIFRRLNEILSQWLVGLVQDTLSG